MKVSKEYKELIEKVRKELKKLGLSQVQIAEELGLKSTTINSAFRGMSETTMLHIANHVVTKYGVPKDYLFPGEKNWQEIFIENQEALKAENKKLRKEVDELNFLVKTSMNKMGNLTDLFERYLDKLENKD